MKELVFLAGNVKEIGYKKQHYPFFCQQPGCY